MTTDWDEFGNEVQEDPAPLAQKSGRASLDYYFAQREAEILAREEAVREMEAETLARFHRSEAAAAASAAKLRLAQAEITPEMGPDQIYDLFRRHGL